MKCFIGLDIGTSAIKGAIVSQDGMVLGTAHGPFEYFNKNGGKLLDTEHFLSVCYDVIAALAKSKGDYEIAAICPCCASGNMTLLDKDNKPLIPIIGWQSNVDAEEAATYYTDEEKLEIYNKVGWRPGRGFTAIWLPYIKKHMPSLFEKINFVCMSAEYLVYSLTGSWGISQSMGTPFYLMDQEKGVYNKWILDRLGITENMLPPIYDKGTVIGKTKAGIDGIPAGVPVVLGSFDHPSCATGAGVYEPGEMLLSCGTSWVELFPVETREKAQKAAFLIDRFMLDGAPYCVMTSVASLSIKIDALREHFLGKISHKAFDEYAASAPKGCNGLEFNFTEEDYKKGKNFDKGCIARAIIEGAAKLLAANLKKVEERGLKAEKITMVGGITNSDLCVKIVAETLGMDISVVNGISAGAVGAAMLAAIGEGTFKNEKDAFAKMNFERKVFKH